MVDHYSDLQKRISTFERCGGYFERCIERRNITPEEHLYLPFKKEASLAVYFTDNYENLHGEFVNFVKEVVQDEGLIYKYHIFPDMYVFNTDNSVDGNDVLAYPLRLIHQIGDIIKPDVYLDKIIVIIINAKVPYQIPSNLTQNGVEVYDLTVETDDECG